MVRLFSTQVPLVLASASPRRHALLSDLGLDFSIVTTDGAEPLPLPNEDPSEYAMRAAQAKALSVSVLRPDALVIGADTVVVLADSSGPIILGKPVSEEEALAMLLHLAGRTHSVVTGCCIVWPQYGMPVATPVSTSYSDRTLVSFAPWPEEVLRAYVRTGESGDKAGAYAIQGIGAFLSTQVDGCWSTVVGLPVTMTAKILLDYGAIKPCGLAE